MHRPGSDAVINQDLMLREWASESYVDSHISCSPPILYARGGSENVLFQGEKTPNAQVHVYHSLVIESEQITSSPKLYVHGTMLFF